MKIAIIVLGKPSSGKDTQAELLAKRFNLVSAKSSVLIKQELYKRSKGKKTATIAGKKFNLIKERKRHETGLLNTPYFVIALIERKIKNTAKRGKGIVFSGSARTLPEAKEEIVLLDKLYGKNRSFYLYLDIPNKIAVQRAVLRSREDGLDKLIKKRIKVFYKETGPVLKLLKQQKRLVVVDGRPTIPVIHKNILRILKRKLAQY